jgi:DNA-binding CsgD family transcriptional regulator/tetratricopeptide (TPR) repeat protein
VAKASSAAGHIVGREAELAALEEFLGSDEEPRALVLTGGPGVGKTSLWEAGIEAARRRSLRVLRASGSGADTQLSFAALIDLLDGIELDGIDGLPPPQRQALEVGLYRAEASSAPDSSALALGVLSALRSLAAEQLVLLAVDDLQWLDETSVDALAFAARRLDAEPVVFLLARRPGPSSALERALDAHLSGTEVGTLSIGAMRRMLSERLALTLPRHVLRRVFETTLGNPLFSLEVGRTIAASGAPALTEDVPLPDAIEDLLGTRVAQLEGPVRRLLLALALDPDLRVSRLAAIADQAVLEDALDAGVITLERDRVRPAHPLLAAAAKSGSRARDRRALHLRLAEVSADEELRALHLALATQLPDEALAETVGRAAAGASARGSAQQAVVLGEHALRLTPADSPVRSERLLELAGYLEVAGERQRVTDLLEPELGLLTPRDRARAWLRLSEGGAIESLYDSVDYLERALAVSEGDEELRALVLAKKAHLVPAYVMAIPDAEAWSLEAMPAARRSGPELERTVLHGLGWARVMRGQPIDDISKRFRECSDAAAHLTDSPEPVEALRLMWRGHVDEARRSLREFLALSDARGEEVSYALQRMSLCDLELRAGDWDAAERLLDEWASADRQLLIRETYLRSRAHLAVGRGRADEAKRLASESLAGAEPCGYFWQVNEARRALGGAALLAHEPEAAAEHLGAVWEHMRREGVDEPGAFPVAPDLVEALVALDRPDEAREVTDRLRGLAEAQEHPWGLASAKRSRGLIDGSPDDLADAAEAYGALGLHFDRARTLLALGRVQRRTRQWGSARAALEQAAREFSEMGSPGWAQAARAELARVGGRRKQSPGELTPTERRVAGLAADGLANKEIASTLFITVRTVEEHLRNTYAKLGIRSRTQLARRLSELN